MSPTDHLETARSWVRECARQDNTDRVTDFLLEIVRESGIAVGDLTAGRPLQELETLVASSEVTKNQRRKCIGLMRSLCDGDGVHQ